MEGIGGVLMQAVHANTFPFLCTEELKVLEFQIREDGDELLPVKGGIFDHLLEAGVIHHWELVLADLVEFSGGCSGHSVKDMSDDVQWKLVMADGVGNSFDAKTGFVDILARKICTSWLLGIPPEFHGILVS